MVSYLFSCGCSAVWKSRCSFRLLRWVFIKWRCVVRCEWCQVDQTCAKVLLAWLNWYKLCLSAGCLTKLIPLGLKRWWSAMHLNAPPICCNLINVMVSFVQLNVASAQMLKCLDQALVRHSALCQSPVMLDVPSTEQFKLCLHVFTSKTGAIKHEHGESTQTTSGSYRRLSNSLARSNKH